MKRLGLAFIILGFAVIVTSVAVASAAPTAGTASTLVANLPPAGATYVGSDTCFTCHSAQYRDWSQTLHSHMIQDAAANPKAVLADFGTGDDVRAADIGGEKRAYTAKDVAFTMGNQYRQRYILKTDSGYQVLPGQWNVADKKWVKAEAADWLKDCAGCHTTGFNVTKQTFNELSVGCETCHGPGSVHVDKAKALPKDTKPVSDTIHDLRGTIVKTVDPAVCGQCHNKGTSPDKQHEYPVGYVVGGPLDETMFIPAKPTGKDDDPYFYPDGKEKAYGMQYVAWQSSRHGNQAMKDLQTNAHAGDTCAACHSTDYAHQDKTFPQDAVTLKTAKFDITCVQCHAPHGGAAAGSQLVQESYNLCVSCHNGTSAGATPIVAGGAAHHPMREMFEGISFIGLKPTPSRHFSNEAHGPVCASCHMSGAVTADEGNLATHTWKIVLPTNAAKGQADSCTGCHTLARSKDNTPENLTFQVEKVQKDTKKRIDDLNTDLKTVQDAHKDWDPAAKDKSKEQLDAERVSTLVSFVVADGSSGFHNPEYTDLILTEAEKLMDGLMK